MLKSKKCSKTVQSYIQNSVIFCIVQSTNKYKILDKSKLLRYNCDIARNNMVGSSYSIYLFIYIHIKYKEE